MTEGACNEHFLHDSSVVEKKKSVSGNLRERRLSGQLRCRCVNKQDNWVCSRLWDGIFQGQSPYLPFLSLPYVCVCVYSKLQEGENHPRTATALPEWPSAKHPQTDPEQVCSPSLRPVKVLRNHLDKVPLPMQKYQTNLRITVSHQLPNPLA